ncbi:MAG TPA: tetratricopeptide repeat protein [Anaerolineaceae bacterium]|nr:tetratricopeptide repeat protein [Anaerolineaceae bacterium]
MSLDLEVEQLEQAIRALEAQRAVLGDAILDTTLAPMLARLTALKARTHASTAQQRKLITVLVTDLSGFTALGERMDAEDLSAMMNNLWQRIDALLSARGGWIYKHLGDAVIAIWGLETTSENDAEQAVQAALDIRAEVHQLSPAAELPLRLHTGIGTGLALIGVLGSTSERSVTGEPLNSANQLVHRAASDEIIISRETYLYIRGLYDVQPVAVAAAGPPCYRVLAARQRAFRLPRGGVEGIETHTVGRAAELRQLQSTWERVIGGGPAGIFLVSGDAGVGKTRLLYDFLNWLDLHPRDFWLLQGRATPQMARRPYALMHDVFVHRFNILDSDSATQARAKFENGVVNRLGEDAREKAHFMGHLLGFDFSTSPHLGPILNDSRQIRDRATFYMQQLIEILAAQDPILFCLEDLQWADASSLELLDGILAQAEALPVMGICTTRPVLLQTQPRLGRSWPGLTQLNLKPLSKAESRQLVTEILQKMPYLPQVLVELVVNRAEGNPYYIEEMIKVLIEDGVILKTEEEWLVQPARLAGLRVPLTLTGIIQSRLDALPPAERDILQRASILGRLFWDEAVAALQESDPATYQPPSPESLQVVRQALAELSRRELIAVRAGSLFAGAGEYVFSHAIVQEVTYESILKRQRRLYHRQVARWLMHRSGDRVDEQAGAIAEHFERSEDLAGAVQWYRLAGERAASQFANADAVQYLARAMELMPAADRAGRFAVLLRIERLHHLLGQRHQQVSVLDALHLLAEELQQTTFLVEVLLREAAYAEAIGDYNTAIQRAEAALNISPADKFDATGHLVIGQALSRMGNIDAARSHLEQALDLSRRAGEHGSESESLRILGNTFLDQNNYTEARLVYERSLQVARSSGNRWVESWVLNNLGLAALLEGRADLARTVLQQSADLAQEIGNRQALAYTLGNLGDLSCLEGDHQRANQLYQRSLQLCRSMEDRLGEAMGDANLGRLALYFGRLGEADFHLTQALELNRSIGNRTGEADVMARRAQVALYLNELENARQWSVISAQTAEEVGDLSSLALALLVQAQALAVAGQPRRAADAWQRAFLLYTGMDQVQLALNAQAGLAWACWQQGRLTEARQSAGEVAGALLALPPVPVSEALWAALTTWQVLTGLSDPRATDVLQAAGLQLLAQAERIEPSQRQSFLQNIPHHRLLLATYQQEYGTSQRTPAANAGGL